MPVDTNGASMLLTCPGVYTKPGVMLSDQVRGFLLALKVAAMQKLVVTSGTRTPRAQALAMVDDLAKTGTSGWYALYRRDDLIAEIVKNGTKADQVEATLTAQEARGDYLSNHQGGRAVDLRTRGLTSAERTRLIEVGEMLGAKVVDEGDHIHMGGIGAAFLPFSGRLLAAAGLGYAAVRLARP